MQIKSPVPTSITKPITKLTEKLIEQTKTVPQSPKVHDKIYLYQIALFLRLALEWTKEKSYKMSIGKFPYTLIQFIDPLLN